MSKDTTAEDHKIETNFMYEEEIIDPILNCIKDNQEYLTQKENLTQLAKLGYLYNTLWYAGRVCWGYEGRLWNKYKQFKDQILIEEYGDDGEDSLYTACENNPKYKIEMCEPINEEIDNYIYDAWGMHVSNDMGISYKEFHTTVYEGKVLSNLDIKLLKLNKTADEWVEVLTDKDYEYSSIYPNKKSVYNHLLCVIGNGYGFSTDGFVYSEAGGADQDSSSYGDWENVIFRKDIQKMVDKIMNSPFVKETIDSQFEMISAYRKEQEDENHKQNKSFYKMLKKSGKYKKSEGRLSRKELQNRIENFFVEKGLRKKKGEEYNNYYPISSSSIIHTICDEESRKRNKIVSVDQSYIDASIEICKEILANSDKEEKNNIEFAKKGLFYLGFEEYGDMIPKEIDKYGIEKQINDILKTLNLKEIDLSKSNFNSLKGDGYYVDFRDTAKDTYGDNNFYIGITYDDNEKVFPAAIYNSTYILGNTGKYNSLYKGVVKSLKEIEDVEEVLFFYSNTPQCNPNGKVLINIEVHTKGERIGYLRECIADEKELNRRGFVSNSNTIRIKSNGYILSTSKPTPLGSEHPNNTDGDRYFSTNKGMEIHDDATNEELCSFNIDERGYNTIGLCNDDDNSVTPLQQLVLDSYKAFKASDPNYGTYDNDTRKGDEGIPLMLQDFILYLKNVVRIGYTKN
jgi:hypothetical protein